MDKEKIRNSDVFKQLPEEIKEKLLKCTSEEEAMAILKEEMIPVTAEELQAVAGGACECSDHYDTDCFAYG